jgi:two-component system LytT family response regulator
MLRAIIIDDEPHCSERLAALLIKYCVDMVKLEGIYNNNKDGILAIEELNPDLLLLDIHIGDQTGFELLHHFPNPAFDVIFTTAHDAYAVKAFRMSAIDYLMKPVESAELVKAVQKANENRELKRTKQRIESLVYNLGQKNSGIKRICIPTTGQLHFFHSNEILRFESIGNYTQIFLKEKQKILVAKTLKEFDEMLDGFGFFRIHQSHLINMDAIKSFNRGKGGEVVMNDGTVIEVSVRKRDEFLKAMIQG